MGSTVEDNPAVRVHAFVTLMDRAIGGSVCERPRVVRSERTNKRLGSAFHGIATVTRLFEHRIFGRQLSANVVEYLRCVAHREPSVARQ
jgi:hypothetical protein